MIRFLVSIAMAIGCLLLLILSLPGILMGMAAGLMIWSYQNGVNIFNRVCLRLMY